MIKKWLSRFNLCNDPGFYIINFLIFTIIILISLGLTFLVKQGLSAGYEILRINSLELLQSIVTLLWLYVFTLISIMPLSFFAALYVYFFSSQKSKFIKILSFFQSLPEFLLAIFVFSLFTIFLNISENSILLFGFALFLIIFPIFFFIIFNYLNSLDEDYHLLFYNSDNKIKFLIFKVLPQISSYLLCYILRVLFLVNSVGFIFFAVSYLNTNSKIPLGLSDSGIALSQKFYLNLINVNMSNNLFISIIFFLLLINIIFAYLELFIKKLFLNKTQF